MLQTVMNGDLSMFLASRDLSDAMFALGFAISIPLIVHLLFTLGVASLTWRKTDCPKTQTLAGLGVLVVIGGLTALWSEFDVAYRTAWDVVCTGSLLSVVAWLQALDGERATFAIPARSLGSAVNTRGGGEFPTESAIAAEPALLDAAVSSEVASSRAESSSAESSAATHDVVVADGLASPVEASGAAIPQQPSERSPLLLIWGIWALIAGGVLLAIIVAVEPEAPYELLEDNYESPAGVALVTTYIAIGGMLFGAFSLVMAGATGRSKFLTLGRWGTSVSALTLMWQTWRFAFSGWEPYTIRGKIWPNWELYHTLHVDVHRLLLGTVALGFIVFVVTSFIAGPGRAIRAKFRIAGIDGGASAE